MKKATDFKTARIYAKALYESAIQANALENIYADVENLQSVKLSKVKEAECFCSPIIDFKTKKEILETLAKKMNLHTQTLNFLKILTENGEFKILELILQDFRELYNQKHEIAEIVVETIKELSTAQDKLLKEKLSALFEQKIKLIYQIRPEILGGLIIKSGTTLIDLSLKNQLKKIEQLMKGTD